MSADNGFIIRRNQDNKYILQEYSASAEALPVINAKGAMWYDTLEEAVIAYSRLAKANIIEYGLSVDVERITINAPETSYDKARRIVFEYAKAQLVGLNRHNTFGEDEVYVVSVKEYPGDWVALVSTSLPDGKLYEVIHLDDQKHTVLTAYVKCETVTFDD